MGSLEETPEGDYVEAHLLTDPVSQNEDEESGDFGRILYRATFSEMENSYVNYDTVQWILISLLLILVYGVGILMLLYVPVRRYVVRQDIRTRKLYVTANAIVYKVTRPVFLPCFGVSKREKHVLLHLVTDVVIEQGCLQSSFGISSVRIEGMGVQSRPTPGDDVRIQGIANPKLFKRIVLNAASNIRKGQRAQDGLPTAGGAEDSLIYETPPHEISRGGRHSQHWAWRPGVAGLTSWQVAYSPSLPVIQNRNAVNIVNVNGEVLLRKLEAMEATVKRLEVLIESQQPRHAQQMLPSASSTAADAGSLRKAKSGIDHYEVLIESQQPRHAQQILSSASSTAADAGSLRKAKSGVDHYEVPIESHQPRHAQQMLSSASSTAADAGSLRKAKSGVDHYEVPIESHQPRHAQQMLSSASSTAADAGSLRKAKSGVDHYEVPSEIRNHPEEICDENASRQPE